MPDTTAFSSDMSCGTFQFPVLSFESWHPTVLAGSMRKVSQNESLAAITLRLLSSSSMGVVEEVTSASARSLATGEGDDLKAMGTLLRCFER